LRAWDRRFRAQEMQNIGPRWRHDVQLSYQRDERLSLFASINNLTDEKPFVSSDDYPIDSVGRYFSVGARMGFR
jgi:outer membrane receptor protein involved in Fe transport